MKHGPVLGHASSLIRARPVLVQKRFEGTRAELENPAGHITTAEASESLYFFDSKCPCVIEVHAIADDLT